MEFQIKKSNKKNLYNLMREIGYISQGRNEEREELIFTRPGRGYPRFHLFLKQGGENLIFNLHLDQKKPVYKGSSAHAGEYSGELVAKETERIKEILK